jgi:hypothetical protein
MPFPRSAYITPRVRLARVQTALDLLRQAQSALRSVEADKAAAAVARARKSVEGAERHAQGLVTRQDPIYVIYDSGRRREFMTLGAAKIAAEQIFNHTGSIVGIERKTR